MGFFDILLDPTNELLTAFIRILPQLGIALCVLLLTWIAERLARGVVNRLLRRGGFRRTLV